MGDTSVCYFWEYEDEGPPTGTFTPNCHPRDSEDSLLCFFKLSYCLWYDFYQEQRSYWHFDETEALMAGFRACGMVVMAWWACAVVARAMERLHGRAGEGGGCCFHGLDAAVGRPGGCQPQCQRERGPGT